MPSHPDPVAANVRAEMARRRLTQTDVALLLNLSQNAVSRRLRGSTPWRLADLQALAQHFGIPLAALIEQRDGVGAA